MYSNVSDYIFFFNLNLHSNSYNFRILKNQVKKKTNKRKIRVCGFSANILRNAQSNFNLRSISQLARSVLHANDEKKTSLLNLNS